MLMNMKELLTVAKKHKFAVPAFNIGSFEVLKAVMEAVEEVKAPVILEIHPDELDYFGGEFVETIKSFANKTKLPVVIHLDHGANVEQVMKAIRYGFTSVMIDGSSLSYAENSAITKSVVALAKPLQVSVEAELGTIGSTGLSFEGGASEVIYTDPNEAVKFVKETGVDTLAIAIGTAHGLYPKDFKPKLNLPLLETLNECLDVPLVLHGGSGNPDDEIERSVGLGVCKVNISSDVKSVLYGSLKAFQKNNPDIYEPFMLYTSSIEDAKKVIIHKLKLLHTAGKADLYQ